MSTQEIQQRLAEPFPADAISWKPQTIKGDKAMAVAYIDARDVQDRLDTVLGTASWQDEYEVLNDGSVICRLRLKLGEEWITKTDVGSPSEQPDGGDRLKAAFSDALKRAAVKFGVGRFLYSFPRQWCKWDAARRCFIDTPKMPVAAKPASAQPAKPAATSPQNAITIPDSGLVAYCLKLVATAKMDVGTAMSKLNARYKVSYTDWNEFEPDQLRAFASWLEKQ